MIASLTASTNTARAATSILGDTNVEANADYNPAGTAEAFSAKATASGSVSGITVYVDAGTTVTSLTAGLYADSSGQPGGLIGQGTIASPIVGAWDTVPIPAVAITAGATYWIAILTPNGGGVLYYRDKGNGGSPTLTANQSAGGTLPTSWTTQEALSEGPISAYASGAGASGPVISAVQASGATTSGVTITWTTSTPADSQVQYGTTTSYGLATTRDPTLVTSHSQTLSGLTSGTLYDFEVISSDGSGRTTTSANFTFSTTGGTGASVGQWSPIMNWPLVAVHVNLLPTGQLLMWDGWQTPTPTQVWNPGSQAFTQIVNSSGLFCSGVVQLADGRILVVGGHDQATGYVETGVKDANIFDPATNTWSRAANMGFARWYPSATLLPDGRVLVVSGESTPGVWVDTPEVYDPVANTWTQLSSVSTSQVHEPEYPLSYLLPSGKVLVIAPSTGEARVLDVSAQTWTSVGVSPVQNGSAVMYRPGQILYTGGGNIASETNPAQKTATVLDMTGATPAWKTVSSMGSPRYEHTMVNLPDGTVFTMGGAAVTSQQTTNDTLPTEIWNPATSTFTTMAAQAEGRIYHSTALLMPDGRVLVAGGGRYNSAVDHFTAQYFSPPYLFKGARPTIASAPSSGTYGSKITVQTPDAANIGSISLIDLADDTHTTDMAQRDVPLTFTAGSGSLSVQLPSSASQAPPGYYMLFITTNGGVPSTASMLKISGSGAEDTTPPTVSMTAPAGGSTVSGASVAVSANATDNVAVASTQFLLDGSPLGPPLTSAPYQIAWDSTKVANGPHQLSAKAIDTSGNSATATAVTVAVSNSVQSGSLAEDAQVSIHGPGPVVTPGLSTSTPGDWLVAFASSDGPSTGQSLTVSGGGLAWSLVKRANSQAGTAEVWSAFAPNAISGVTVSASPSSGGYDEALTVAAFSGSSGVGASTAGGAGSGAPSVSLTATGAGSLVAGAGTDWDSPSARTVGSGQKLLDQWVDTGAGDTFWSQITTAPTPAAGTVVTINDTAPTADRWNLTAAEILSADRPPPQGPVISAVGSSGITSTSATVTWQTNEPANSQIDYGTSTAYGSSTSLDATLTTSHSQTINGLTGATTYHYRVKSTDGAGILATSPDGTFTTTTPPPPPGTVAVDSQVSVHGTGPLITPPLTTSGPGDVLVALASSDGPASGQTVSVSGPGLTWTLARRANTQGGTAEVWTALAPNKLNGVAVTASQTAGSYDQALTVLAFSGASGAGAGASAASGSPTVSLTTSSAGSLVVGAGTDWDEPLGGTVGSGQKLVDQWVDTGAGDSFWSQMTTAPTAAAGTAVTINDTAPTGDRWNLVAVEVVPATSGASSTVAAQLTSLRLSSPRLYLCPLGIHIPGAVTSAPTPAVSSGLGGYPSSGPGWSDRSSTPASGAILMVLVADIPRQPI